MVLAFGARLADSARDGWGLGGVEGAGNPNKRRRAPEVMNFREQTSRPGRRVRAGAYQVDSARYGQDCILLRSRSRRTCRARSLTAPGGGDYDTNSTTWRRSPASWRGKECDVVPPSRRLRLPCSPRRQRRRPSSSAATRIGVRDPVAHFFGSRRWTLAPPPSP